MNRLSRTLRRCVLVLESEEHDTVALQANLDGATADIDVLLDQVEADGRAFNSPKDVDFAEAAQHGQHVGAHRLEVSLWCEPKLSEAELITLTLDISAALDGVGLALGHEDTDPAKPW